MVEQSKSNNSNKSTIDVVIVGAHGYLYKGTAEMVIATAANGELGIKPRHIPFLATLKPGNAIICNGDDEEVFYIAGGVIEVQPNMVTILADHATRAKDIDEAKAEQARQDAEKMFLDKTEKVDYAKLQAQLAQSIAQLRALRRFKNQAEKRRS